MGMECAHPWSPCSRRRKVVETFAFIGECRAQAALSRNGSRYPFDRQSETPMRCFIRCRRHPLRLVARRIPMCGRSQRSGAMIPALAGTGRNSKNAAASPATCHCADRCYRARGGLVFAGSTPCQNQVQAAAGGRERHLSERPIRSQRRFRWYRSAVIILENAYPEIYR